MIKTIRPRKPIIPPPKKNLKSAPAIKRIEMIERNKISPVPKSGWSIIRPKNRQVIARIGNNPCQYFLI